MKTEKTARDFTDDERAAIVARANEVSIKQTAEEFEISPDDVMDLIYDPAPILDSDNGNNTPKLRPLRELTDADRRAIIRMSNEIGQPKTAKAFNVSLRTVGYCRNEYAHKKGINTVRIIVSPKKGSPKKGFKDASSTATEAVKTAEAIPASDVADAVNVAEADKAAEVVKTVKTVEISVLSNETEKSIESALATDTSTSMPSDENTLSAFNNESIELKIENELLKSKLSHLTMQINKLSTAVRNLI